VSRTGKNCHIVHLQTRSSKSGSGFFFATDTCLVALINFITPYDMRQKSKSRHTLRESYYSPGVYSSIVLTQSHSPFKFSFHKVTLLSPPETARTLPLKLQLTRHTTASKVGSSLQAHSSVFVCEVHIRTVLSCDAEAI
jgi:hypothetical protein